MLRKYLPLIALLIAVILFIWIKYNQHTTNSKRNTDIVISPSLPEPFDRNITHLLYSRHARCRMNCRKIDESEVQEIVSKGNINRNKIEKSAKGISYPLEGITHDGQHVRIVVAPHGNELVIVTVIDLEEEWQCNCN